VTGLDIVKSDVVVPDHLKDRLSLRHYSGDLNDIPFERGSFDKVLASEVLCAFPDSTVIFRHLKELLRPGGKLIVVNAVGRPTIEAAYRNNSALLKLFKLSKRYPKTFKEFEKSLQVDFRTKVAQFANVGDIIRDLTGSGLVVEKWILTPVDSVVGLCEWYQFGCRVLFGSGLSS
jgi:SAM-dependent methyltransferase